MKGKTQTKLSFELIKKKKVPFKNEATSGLKVKSSPYESRVTKFPKEEKENEEEEKKRS